MGADASDTDRMLFTTSQGSVAAYQRPHIDDLPLSVTTVAACHNMPRLWSVTFVLAIQASGHASFQT